MYSQKAFAKETRSDSKRRTRAERKHS